MSEKVNREAVAASLGRAPIFGVVRTPSTEEAEALARRFIASGLELVEITFTVPGAAELIASLRSERGPQGPPWIGAGTVTSASRAASALASGADFLLTPNVEEEVARVARDAGRFLVLGALTPTEIIAAHRLGADLVKVYPLPPIGGPAYLATVRQPIDDVPMLAAGGFGVEEIPDYRRAGATAFGVGAQLFAGAADDRTTVRHALAAARGDR